MVEIRYRRINQLHLLGILDIFYPFLAYLNHFSLVALVKGALAYQTESPYEGGRTKLLAKYNTV